MSPAVPASSLEFSAALYSFGAVGWKFSLMPGWLFSKAGMIFSCQIGRSSLRQLSMVSVASAARAGAAAPARTPDAATPARAQDLNAVMLMVLPPWRPDGNACCKMIVARVVMPAMPPDVAAAAGEARPRLRGADPGTRHA